MTNIDTLSWKHVVASMVFTLFSTTLTKAPKLPKEDKDKFDLVIDDVHAPAQDGLNF
jgi:hypothetical protein